MNFLPQYSFKHPAKRFLAALFDWVGRILFFIPGLFKAPLDPSRIQKILVIRLDSLGDAAMTLPALKALRERFPKAKIDLLLTPETAPLFVGGPEADEVFTLECGWFSKQNVKDSWPALKRVFTRIKNTRYDLGIDFRGDLRNALLLFIVGIPQRLGYGITGGGFLLTHCGHFSRKIHQVLLNLRLLTPLGVEETAAAAAPFTYPEARKTSFQNSAGRFLPEGPEPRIVIHPGAGYPSKRWSPAKFKALIKKILEANLGSVVLIGTETEKEILNLDFSSPKLADLRGQTKLEDLPVLFDACQLFIGNDSGPSHVAAAQGLPLLILFSGTNDVAVWHPWAKSLELISHPVPCSPCEARECPLKHHDCMEKISVDQVFEKIQRSLRGLQKTLPFSRKYRIGIDARMMKHSGIGTYLRGLVSGLSDLKAPRDEFRLFGPEGTEPPIFPVSSFDAKIYSLTEQFQYPARLSQCELWHSPHYNIPLINGKTRLVVTIHDLIHWIFRSSFFTPLQALYAGFMLRHAVDRADRIITVSHKTKEDLMTYFQAPADKISVIYEGVSDRFRTEKDPQKADAIRQKYGLPESFFLYVGLLKPHKNVHGLLHAFRTAKKREALGAGLVIVGKKDRRYAPEFKELAELKTGGGVHYIPYAEGDDLAALYHAALALVHPSLYEGFGLTLLEAMACGLPVIASRAASLPEIAGEAAYWMEPGEEESMIGAMKKVESEPVLRKDLILKGHARVQQFSWKQTAAETMAVYQEVLNGS